MRKKNNPPQDNHGKPVPRLSSLGMDLDLRTKPDSGPNQVEMIGSAQAKVEAPGKAEHFVSPSALDSTTEEKKVPSLFVTSPAQEPPLEGKRPVSEKPQYAFERRVVVERSDTLSGIIQRAYGRYEDRLLTMVLEENPEIRTPDYIFIGQVIRLPEAK